MSRYTDLKELLDSQDRSTRIDAIQELSDALLDHAEDIETMWKLLSHRAIGSDTVWAVVLKLDPLFGERTTP